MAVLALILFIFFMVIKHIGFAYSWYGFVTYGGPSDKISKTIKIINIAVFGTAALLYIIFSVITII